MTKRAAKITVLASAVAVATVAGVAGDAAAQASDTTTADTTAIPVAPIRVTVLRTPLPLSRVSHAVTVERVEVGGPGLSLLESLGAVPGLQVDNRYNFSQGDRISVRGLGARSQFGVRGVKVLVDGIPATMPDGQTSLSHLDPQWVDRAEVVRGPASSLWGNAAGGVIQLETGAAPLAGSLGTAMALVGDNGLRHYGGEVGWGSTRCEDAGAPAACAGAIPRPALGIKAAASVLEYDGYRAHSEAYKRFGFARVDWQGRRSALTVLSHGVGYTAQNPGSLSAAQADADPTQAFGFNVAQATGEAAHQAQVGVTWSRALGGEWPQRVRAAVASGAREADAVPTLEVTAWGLIRNLDNPIPPAVIELYRQAAGLRTTVNGTLRAGPLAASWVAGVDAEGQWDDRQNFENLSGSPGALLLDQAETVRSVAPFVEVRGQLVGPVRATAGLRYDRYWFRADDRLVDTGNPDDSGERVMDQLSPTVGLSVELGRGSVYGNVGSSFETPTTTELSNRPDGSAGFNPGLEPQRAWNVELGGRTSLGSRVRLQGALYRMWIRDALIPFEVAGLQGRTFFRNAGSAVHHGAELDVWTRLADGITLRLGWSLVDARFADYTLDGQSLDGNRVPGVAPNRVNVGLAWDGPRGARLALDGRWLDAVPVNDANTASASSYSLLDLRATAPTLRIGGNVLELFGGVDNVLDTPYTSSVVVNAFGQRYFEPGPGRAAYVGLRLR